MTTTASAPTRRARTFGAMPIDPTTRYLDLLQAVARSGTRGAPVLLLSLQTLTRRHEILGGALHSHDGELTVAPGQGGAGGRTVPLAQIASALLADHQGPVAAALGLPVARRGDLVPILRYELAELHLLAPVALEELHLVACAAVLDAAPDAVHRQAVLAYAGIPPHSAKARRMRQQSSAVPLRWVADLIDSLADQAGFHIEADSHAALA